MPKKKTDKKEVLTKKINGKLIFRRIHSSGNLGFNILSKDLVFGEHADFVGFLPPDFDITKHEITGSVTYKINVKKK